MYMFLNCCSTCVTLTNNKGKVLKRFTTPREWNLWIAKNRNADIMCSSSMDFPRDYSDCDFVCNLANYIRNGEPQVLEKKMPRVYKTTFTAIQNTPGIYLDCPGSNSVWAGFKTKKEAETCLLILPEWRLFIRK